MHENANIAFQTQESEKIIQTILSIQTNITASSTGKSPNELVMELAEQILDELPVCLRKEEGEKTLFQQNEEGLIPSLSTVLLQEMVRFKRLLDVIKLTLENL